MQKSRRGTAAALGVLASVLATWLASAPAQAQMSGPGFRGGDDFAPRRPREERFDDRGRRGFDDEDFRPRRRDRDDDFRGGSTLQPRGSFVQTCTDIRQFGAYLEAACRRVDGGYSRSRIDIRDCRTIANRNGRLACD